MDHVLFPLSLQQFAEINGVAKTMQFPPRSLNGFGNALPTVYGPKHIAIPSPNVSVGAKYNLNCEGHAPHKFPR